jgi:hemin uptake protein HemP
MATPNIVPRADSEGGLGTASKYWASAYIDTIYVGAGSVGRDADNLIDFSTDNLITFKVNGASELRLDGNALFPRTSDGLSLGYSSYQWSDFFLASGAVINFDNGDVTLTHASNALTLDGGHLQLTTNFEARFGSSNRLRIYSDNTDAYITNTATDGDIIFQADDSSGGVTTYFQLDGGANAMVASKSIYMADNKRFYAGSGGDLGIFHDGTNSALLNDNGDLFVQQNADGKDIRFQCDDGGGNLTDYLTLDGGLGYMVASKAIRALDSVNIQLGSSGAFTMQHNGTNAILQNLTGDLQIISNKQDKDIVFKGDDGQASDNTTATYFYLDGSSAQHNGSATTALYTNWPDKSRITFGTSHDLQISHDGGNSYVENITNDLILINYADDRDIIFKASTGSAAAEEYFRLDGSVGNTYVNKDMRFVDNVLAIFGNDGDMSIKHDGSNMTMINGTGSMNFYQSTDGGDMVFYCDNGSGGLAAYLTLDGSAGYTVANKDIYFAPGIRAYFGSSGNLSVVHDNSNGNIINTTGDLTIKNQADDAGIIFQSDNGGGGTATYFKLDGGTSIHNTALYTNWPDKSRISMGDSHDLQIYHDGSNSYISDAGTGSLILQSSDLFLRTNSTENSVVCASNAGVTLYYDNSAKLSTTSTGVSVTGGLTTTSTVILSNLPTSDPGTTGQLWNDNGTLKISAGG